MEASTGPNPKEKPRSSNEKASGKSKSKPASGDSGSNNKPRKPKVKPFTPPTFKVIIRKVSICAMALEKKKSYEVLYSIVGGSYLAKILVLKNSR